MKILTISLASVVVAAAATSAFADSVPSANGGMVSGYTDSYTGKHYNNYYDDDAGHLQRGSMPNVERSTEPGEASRPVSHHHRKHLDKDSSE